jgi:hypothetical protein
VVHALNEEVQELVSEALEGAKLSLVEASVFKAADELQRLQKGMVTFKETMRITLESESNSTSRREVGRLLYSRKKEEVNENADLKLLAARGLKSWDDADKELKKARKQARTDAKGEFLRAAGQTPKTRKAFVEGIGDMEHPKWTMEEKRTICHKAVELRHELRKVFGTLVMLLVWRWARRAHTSWRMKRHQGRFTRIPSPPHHRFMGMRHWMRRSSHRVS